jgi:hypothetical protein
MIAPDCYDIPRRSAAGSWKKVEIFVLEPMPAWRKIGFTENRWQRRLIRLAILNLASSPLFYDPVVNP